MIVILAGGGVGTALVLRKSTPPVCPGCGQTGPPVDPLPEAATFTSSDLHFVVAYPDSWTIDNQTTDALTLHTRESSGGAVFVEGTLVVKGDRNTTDTTALIDEGLRLLPPTYSNLKEQSTIRGAHIADADGTGKIYSATLTTSDGTSTDAAVSVVAASKNGLGVVVVGGDPADKGSTGAPVEGDIFDYVLTEFVWPQ